MARDSSTPCKSLAAVNPSRSSLIPSLFPPRSAALNGTSPNTTNYHPLHINRRLAPSSPRTVLVKRDYYGSPWAIRGTTIQGKVKRYGCFYGTLETAVVLLGPNPRSLDDDDDYVWTWLAWGKWEDRHEDTATMWRRNAEYDQPLYLK